MPEIFEWKYAFAALGVFAWSVISVWVGYSIQKAADSIVELNTNMAVVVEKLAGHEKRIERLEEKV